MTNEFTFFLFYKYHYELVDLCIYNTIQSTVVILPTDAPTVPSLASCPITLSPASFLTWCWKSLRASNYLSDRMFQAHLARVLPQTWNQPCLHRTLISPEKWYLETLIWVLAERTATELVMISDVFSGQRARKHRLFCKVKSSLSSYWCFQFKRGTAGFHFVSLVSYPISLLPWQCNKAWNRAPLFLKAEPLIVSPIKQEVCEKALKSFPQKWTSCLLKRLRHGPGRNPFGAHKVPSSHGRETSSFHHPGDGSSHLAALNPGWTFESHRVS